jgi:carbonic anhydrase
VTERDDPAAPLTAGFADLLVANGAFADGFTLGGFDGVAHRGVAIVTCMDSRIDPLGMLGLVPGDAKILRNLGGRVTDATLAALVLATNLLGVERVLVVAHTRCAGASNTETQLRERVARSARRDASWMSFHVVEDQDAALRGDVARVRTHPLVPQTTLVGGFVYDVDTGRLRQVI